MVERKINTILKIISQSKEPIGSKDIADRLKDFGIDLSERTVRHHMKALDEKGLTQGKWKEGRVITEKGVEELHDALVSDKVGFISARIETMSYKMDFDLDTRQGKVILNIGFLPVNKFVMAKQIMAEVYDHEETIPNLVALAKEGQSLGGVEVPAGKVAFGTLCSINLNAVLIKSGIPVESKFGGVLQIEDYKPLRFTDLISYDGTTLDPVEIFIESKMTNVRGVISSGSGRLMAGFREIPAIAVGKAEQLLEKAQELRLGTAWLIGKPGQSLLGVPVGPERVGLVFLAGLNPIAALEEAGIETQCKALTALVDYQDLKSFWDVN